MEKRAPGCGSTCSAAGHGGPRDPSRWRRDPMRLRRTDPSWVQAGSWTVNTGGCRIYQHLPR
ncbi:hypothetical protein SETIT_9G114700v2 [Setaria italica]|uniref:Uncharacterized protein n=2 Tax=Setaria TaxID=4554 RepID=A0A368SFH0_SETIT|nr:hypothetical protein SETIT_9G114700v2 [Setaria italica]TKV91683.1 hypothetical protein SEVIR_9G113300v2 [Setaria viridis]